MSQPPSPRRPKNRPSLPRLEQREDLGLIAGVDEAGRGPLAGPVVAAAVILHTPRKLLDVRVDDSKRLSARQRRQAYKVILRHATVGVGIVPADVIDQDNIRQATLLAMVQAVEDLELTPAVVLVDGNDPPPLDGIPCRAIISGDRLNYHIACASIVAKVTRDRLMAFYHRLFPAYGFSRHKGYGTDLHQQNLTKHGPCFLHRMTFQPLSASAVAGALSSRPRFSAHSLRASSAVQAHEQDDAGRDVRRMSRKFEHEPPARPAASTGAVAA